MDPDRLHMAIDSINWRDTILIYVEAAIAGALGGCGAVAIHLSRPKRYAVYVALLLMMAMVSGLITGAVLLAVGDLILGSQVTVHDVLGLSMASGFAGSMGLLFLSVTSKIVMRFNRKELELQLNEVRDREDGKNARKGDGNGT